MYDTELSEAGVHTAPETAPLLTVIMPVFNEPDTVDEIIRRVLDVPINLELIVVDDGSTVETQTVLRQVEDPRVTVLFHSCNRGKGSAIRTGLKHAMGTYTIIQDADLEYDPNEYPLLIGPLLCGDAKAVYGSRYLKAENGRKFRLFRYGVKFLNLIVRVMYGQLLTDSATCYKAASTKLMRDLDLQCERFEFCPEVTAKLCRLGIPITEVSIGYNPRGTAEGKKIRVRDGIEAIHTYWKHRSWKLNGPEQ